MSFIPGTIVCGSLVAHLGATPGVRLYLNSLIIGFGKTKARRLQKKFISADVNDILLVIASDSLQTVVLSKHGIRYCYTSHLRGI